VTPHNDDDWTIDRWKVEPKFLSLNMLDGLDVLDWPQTADQAPPLWKDLTLGLVVAIALWVVAAVIFR
jgi:hypothetical protein